MDLFSRKIVGWSAAPTITSEVVLNAVLMAVATSQGQQQREEDGHRRAAYVVAPATSTVSTRTDFSTGTPDFNPIEQAFAKLKAFLRAARPRTFDHVNTLVATALALFTPTECANYVRHCGYRVATAI